MKNRRERGIAAKSDKNSDTGQPGYLNRLRGSFFPGGRFFAEPAERGARTAAGVFALSGRQPVSQHRLSGAHELPQACSPLTGGEVFAEPQRGVRLPGGGTRG